ncbi:hypothetical protein [Desulfolutivibrio sp.]|uniref:hypothetical protein n=1 Tax=Desulfolutivibrio sp. TaxID=2773296 RepID=UPI002F96A38D
MDRLIVDSGVLFYRLWSLEYVYRNYEFRKLRDEVRNIENELKEEIDKIRKEEIDTIKVEKELHIKTIIGERAYFADLFAKYPWLEDEPSPYFEELYHFGQSTECYKSISQCTRDTFAKGNHLSDLIISKFGFCYAERPARDSTYLLENINDNSRIVFPLHERFFVKPYFINAGDIYGFGEKIMISVGNEEPYELEKRPGDVFICINFDKPLPVVMDEFRGLYLWWNRDVGDYEPGNRYIAERIMYKNIKNGVIPETQAPRAIGLWLWDRVKELKNKRGAVKQALKEFHEAGYLERLGLVDIEEADLRFWCRRTDACIKAAEVLPFTKRKKGTKES